MWLMPQWMMPPYCSMHWARGPRWPKLDIRDAYRIIPVHPEERTFLGVQWNNSVYVDCQLPFGLASAPAIFNALADALEWILRQRGIRAVVHYLDDFLLLGAPGSSECSQALAVTLATCQELGVSTGYGIKLKAPLAPSHSSGSACTHCLSVSLSPSPSRKHY